MANFCYFFYSFMFTVLCEKYISVEHEKEYEKSGLGMCSFAYSLFCSKLFIFKEQREEQFAFVALYKRATMSESLSSFFKKEQPWAICSFSRVSRSFAQKKPAIPSKNQRANSQPCKQYSIIYNLSSLHYHQ